MKSLGKFPKAISKTFDTSKYYHDVRMPVAEQSKYTGMFGVEIEVEGNALPRAIGTRVGSVSWVTHDEGSLRAPNGVDRGGAEYVFSQPCDLEESREMLTKLFEEIQTQGGEIVNSYRTSTHVHINMRDFKLNNLASFVVLWGMFEDVLAEYSGEGRAGNLFALRLSDSDFAVTAWIDAFKSGDFAFNRDYRYLALNGACLGTFGSLEVRTFRGISSVDEVMPWLEALKRLREVADEYADPFSIATDFSAYGARGMIERLFAGLPILSDLLAIEDANPSTSAGFRRVQPIIYCLPWQDVLPEIAKVYVPNPFDTGPKKKPAAARRTAEMRFNPAPAMPVPEGLR
jgi:hypothetical protein